jgi:ATP-binding cassette subfamily B protein
LKEFLQQVRKSASLALLAIRLLWRTSPRLLVLLCLLLLLQAIFAPFELILARMVINRAALDLGIVSVADPWAAAFSLPIWIVLATGLIALSQLLQPFITTFQSMIGDRMTGSMMERLIETVNQWKGLSRFEDAAFADDLQRSRTSAARSGLILILFGARTASAVFSIVVFGVILARLNPLVPVVLILLTFPAMARQWNYETRIAGRLYAQTPDARQLMYSRDVLLTPEAGKDVRLYNLGGFFLQRYQDVFQTTNQQIHQLRLKLMGPLALSSALAALAAGSIYFYLVAVVAQGQRSLGDLVMYGGAALLMQTLLISISSEFGLLPMMFAFLPSMARILGSDEDLPTASKPLPIPSPIREGFAFVNVTFTYPGQDKPTLDGLSLTIRPGDSIALVGLNGAGKTTLIKLLLRFYDPTSGQILLDNVDLREYDIDDLRSHLGVIFQDFVRYELTVQQNIGIGRINEIDSSAAALNAATRAGASGLIAELDSGLETRVGREFGDQDLSGGQWQKIALARAFIRDCDLMVLDEPTSALDIQTEHDVFQRFHELTRGRMTVLISHRLSTTRIADRVLYLDGGKIIEEGSHDQLIAANGEYARLFKLQAAHYIDQESEATLAEDQL